MKSIRFFALLLSLFLSTANFAQRGGGGHRGHHQNHHPNNKKVIVKGSPYRPHKVVVYHPYWRPKYAYNRRWVYFPKYNIYWDNWRNHYVFWNGTIWISQPAAPPIIVNVNLENEKNAELKEDEDDVDDVYKNNSKHQQEIKPE